MEEESPHPAGPSPRLRCADPAHAGRRLDLRGPHDVPAAPGGRRGPAARPVSPPAAARRRGDGRGLPGRAPAPEAPLRREADPAGRRDRPAGPGAVRARGPPHRHALAPEHRRGLRLRPGRGRDLLLRHGVPAGPEPGRAGRAPRPAAAGAGGVPAAAGLRGAGRGARGGPDPPRHQAVEHLRRAARGDRRRGQAARLRAGPARGDRPTRPT